MIIRKKSNRINFFLLLINVVASIFCYFSYKTNVAEKLIIQDSKRSKRDYTIDQVDKMFIGYPNISSSSLPVDIWKVQYSLWDNNIDRASKFISSAVEANPYTFTGEFLKSQIFSALGQSDSAVFYSKKAFQGWPKNINHYNTYLDNLEVIQDTVALIKAFNFLDSNLVKRPEYFKRFYSSFNKIKLSFLVTEFEDQKDLELHELLGNTYIRGYNFPNGQVIKDSTLSYTFKSKNIITNQNGGEFYYKIKNDSLIFYFKRDPSKPVAQYFSKYSPEYKTIIFRNVEFEKDKFQDQFFIKLD